MPRLRGAASLEKYRISCSILSSKSWKFSRGRSVINLLPPSVTVTFTITRSTSILIDFCAYNTPAAVKSTHRTSVLLWRLIKLVRRYHRAPMHFKGETVVERSHKTELAANYADCANGRYKDSFDAPIRVIRVIRG